MSNVYTVNTPKSNGGDSIQAGRLAVVQKVSVASSSAATSNAFGANTSLVRVAVNTDCYITFAITPTATTSMTLLPAGSVEYFMVKPGEKAAFIRNSADGVATVTEMEM
jgi:hypothetical protein